ncbi:MAG: K(+)-transporting ATPase subunit C [Anaerovoracaceae bacterium]
MNVFAKSIKFLLIMTLICGILYTGVITVLGQTFFAKQANGSIIEIDGTKYGSEHMGQYYDSDKHMWGRIMNIDVNTYKNKDGERLMYSAPSNMSPASEEFRKIVAQRVETIKEANGNEMEPVPNELVTGSGSGLDPAISVAAAKYQVERLAKANDISEETVSRYIDKATKGEFLGIFGQKTVNVLEVNLMIDGIL